MKALSSKVVLAVLYAGIVSPLLAIAATSPPPCEHFSSLRQPFFGDTHVHTRYSLDASTQGTRTSPEQAYRFARGERIGIQPWTEEGEPLRSLQLARPLDFAVVTDHAELFGEVHLCNTPGSAAYSSWQCKVYRGWPRAAFFMFNTVASRGQRLGMCGEDGTVCREAGLSVWEEMQQAAEAAYDPGENCQFTSFIGYEWTGATENVANLHRNIIFRNTKVPRLPISFVDAPSAEQLWQRLEQECLLGIERCDVLVIPHNSNLSDGQMFLTHRDDGRPMTAEDARRRQQLERLVEVMQHKGSSECYFGPANAEDELCAFEQLPYDKFSGKFYGFLKQPPQPDDGFLRESLREGLRQQQKIGVNPFKLGFIASTDTHIGAPGAVSETSFLGHGGAGEPAGDEVPAGLPDDLEFNPGGLAVLWAEQNNRDSLFEAMRRREAYGTSGPRITLRFFGGWNYSAGLCESPDFAARGYAGGVPMGGDLPRPSSITAAPQFAVAALKDPDGRDLQRVQIIKGWIDGDGAGHETVYEVAGNPNNGASVDTTTCMERGQGFTNLCQVWRDPDFSPGKPAYYYARVVENPSCRWSQRICIANGVDCKDPSTIGEGLEACCSDEHRPVIQERAWSSPIWYTPAP